MANYLSDAPPWTHPGNEQLMEASSDIVDDHEHYAQRLADAIEDRRGVLEAGKFPMRFARSPDDSQAITQRKTRTEEQKTW